MIVVFKLGDRCSKRLSPAEVIKLHMLHAEAHDGKVLFTTGKAPAPKFRSKIDGIILTTADGTYAIEAKIDDMDKYIYSSPKEDYVVPSVWDEETETGKAWYAISSIKEIQGGIHPGDYTCVTDADLLTSISGKAFMVYAK